MSAAALPLAYHADDELAHAERIGFVVLGALLALLAFVLLRRFRPAASGRNRAARIAAAIVAFGLAAFAFLNWAPLDVDSSGFVLAVSELLVFATFAAGLAGPAFAIASLGRAATAGEGRLAALAFVGSLVLPGVLVVWFIACAVTDACFH